MSTEIAELPLHAGNPPGIVRAGLNFSRRACARVASLRLLLQHMVGKIVSGNFRHHAGEDQQGNQVRNCHQAVQRVGDIPHQGAGTGSPDNADQRKDDLVHQKEGSVVLCKMEHKG